MIDSWAFRKNLFEREWEKDISVKNEAEEARREEIKHVSTFSLARFKLLLHKKSSEIHFTCSPWRPKKKFFNQFCAKRKKRNLNESNLHLEGQNSILVPIKVFLSSRFYAWNTFAASKVIDDLLPFGGCAHRKVIIMDTPGSVRWVITCCYHLLCFALWFSNPRLREVWKSLKLQF
jgi:hypothetical protein